MKNYQIATPFGLYDWKQNSGETWDEHVQKLWEEQQKLVDFYKAATYLLRETEIWKSKHETVGMSIYNNVSLEWIVQGMSIKDGIDIIRFDDGTLGIIAYYNGNQEILEWREITDDVFDAIEQKGKGYRC